MNTVQGTFIDGMDLLSEETQISNNGYKMLINGRQRYGSVVPNRKHVEITTLPAGKKQGAVGVGTYKIVFIAGGAYYQNEGDTGWIQIPSFAMSAVEDEYWTLIVPASTFNFGRKLPTSGDINLPIISSVNVSVSGTPAGILVQDGHSQPWIIVFNEFTGSFIARETKTYNDWSNTSSVADDREYVPIGRQMMLLNGIVFLLSADKKRLYRSVSNRPLDFMVNIDVNGNKQPAEYLGGAASVSIAFDYDDITCIQPINIPDAFVYGTTKNIRVIVLDYTYTIFGEPNFSVGAIIKAGVVNQDSFIDILGDYAFVDAEGVVSFNAVNQLQYEGRNSIFSKQLSSILKGKVQRVSRTVSYNNFILFNLETTIGNALVVYDTIIQRWVSIDITAVIDVLKFFVTETVSATHLYALTSTGRLFRLYSDETENEYALLFTKSWAPEKSNIEHKSQHLYTAFNLGLLNGTVRAIEYIDNQEGKSLTGVLAARISPLPYPVQTPVIPGVYVQVEPITFNFVDGRRGKKISYIIMWNSDSELDEFTIMTNETEADVLRQQKASVYEAVY